MPPRQMVVLKSVFVAGSRKFYSDKEEVAGICKSSGIRVSTAGKP